MIVDGVAGTLFTIMANDFIADDPHPLFALTVIFPFVLLETVLIETELDVPVQPDGSDQVYDVAPDTGLTEKVFALF